MRGAQVQSGILNHMQHREVHDIATSMSRASDIAHSSSHTYNKSGPSRGTQDRAQQTDTHGKWDTALGPAFPHNICSNHSAAKPPEWPNADCDTAMPALNQCTMT